jgi:hypothetical protein
MRKLLFLFFLFIATGVYAQSFRAGLQLGLAATQVTGDQLSGFHKVGMFGGVFVNYPTGHLGDFQLELNYIQKGSRKNAHPDEGDYEKYIMRLNYVALPFFYKFKIKEKLSIEIGAEFAYLINSKEFDIYGAITPDPRKEDFSNVDLSAFAGVGIKFYEHFRFIFRYSYSIKPIRPKPDSSLPLTYYDAGQFNEVVITSIQYQF